MAQSPEFLGLLLEPRGLENGTFGAKAGVLDGDPLVANACELEHAHLDVDPLASSRMDVRDVENPIFEVAQFDRREDVALHGSDRTLQRPIARKEWLK
jgi:hypothetical protein